jgi:hypothetical protein
MDGEDQEVAHGANRIMADRTRKTAPHARNSLILRIRHRHLYKRLERRNIPASARVLWLWRGPGRQIDRFRRVSSTPKPASWADPELDLNDGEVPIADAINHVAWLRNKVGGHAMSHHSTELNVVDAHNAQSVARQAIMMAMSVWGSF